MADGSRAVFLSYASQDAEAARRIGEALRAARVEVWLDQSELRGGDAWDQRIRKQIKECALFVPIISANTQARREGYFRLEWHLAEQRSLLIAKGTPFIVPVCVDTTPDAEAIVPDSFTVVQWTRLPGGEASTAFADRVKLLLEPPPARARRDDAPPRSPMAAQPAAASSRRGSRRWLLVALPAVMLLVAAGGVALQRYRRSLAAEDRSRTAARENLPTPRETAPRTTVAETSTRVEKSIAVLPFENRSSEKDSEYFSEGISDELLNALGRVDGLRVVARTSSFAFKGKPTSAQEIGRALNVSHIVEGSVQRVSGRARVIASLVHAETGDRLWSQRFEQDLTDVFAAQDQVAGAIAQALSLRLAPAVRTRAHAVNPAAYELYARGRQAWNLRTEEGLARAEALFNEAIALDPNFAQAYVGIADVWLYAPGPEAEVDAARVISQVNRALEIEPALAEAHATLGAVYYRELSRFSKAEAALRTAIKLNPNYASAHQWLGRLLEADGRLGEALSAHHRAAELDPLSSRIADNYARSLLLAGRTTEALARLDRAVVLVPDNFQAHGWRAWVLVRLGRKAEALEVAGRLAARESDSLSQTFASRVYYALGMRAEGDAAFARIKIRDASAHFLLAAAHRGEDVGALFKTATPSQMPLYYYMPELEALRRDPRFLKEIDALGTRAAFDRSQAERAKFAAEGKR